MPRNYRPRFYQLHTCAHCATSFETKYSRTKYCCDSCRVKAFYVRQDAKKPQPSSAPRELDFSAKNLAVTAAGAGIAAGVNYVFNDRPAQEQIKAQLQDIKQQLDELSLPELTSDLAYLKSYVKAQEQMNSTLKMFMKQNQPERPLKTANKQGQLEGSSGLMALGDIEQYLDDQTSKKK